MSAPQRDCEYHCADYGAECYMCGGKGQLALSAGGGPYREGPLPSVLTKAEELRQVAEDAVAEKLHQLVAALLKRATEAAQQGRTKTEWPWAAEPHQRLADVAEELHLLGFTCSITPDRESVRWFKAADPTLPIWTMEIAW